MSRLGIFESINDVVFIAKTDGKLIEANGAFTSTFGSGGDGESLLEIWPEIREFWNPVIARGESEKQLRADVPAMSCEGRRLTFDVRLFSIGETDSTPGAIAGVALDVTVERDRIKNLEIQATIDPLTGAYNRSQLETLLTQAILNAKRRKMTGCFLLIDIDNFKKINDSHGHSGGDSVLKKVVLVLRENLRASDVIARIGGDEFGVVLTDSNLEAGQVKATQLADALSTIETEGREIDIETSIGLSAFPEHGDQVSDIIKRADIAMYQAKRDVGYGVRAWEDGFDMHNSTGPA